MSTPAAALIDNPLIVKHWRSRLRTSQVVPGAIAVLCLCGVFAWIGHVTGALASGWTFTALCWIAGAVIVIGGANQVAMAVGSAKESGILDFHRVSPLSPATVTLGFLLGAPIREYLLFAMIVPFLVVAGVMGSVSLLDWLNVLVPMLFTAWLVHSFAIYGALVAKKPRASAVGVVVVCFVVLIFVLNLMEALRARNGPGAAANDLTTIGFFGVPLPRIAFLAIYEGAAITFFLIAATRKMRSERALTYAKWEALVCMATVVALALGVVWSLKGLPGVVPGLLYVFAIAGIVLAATITPNRNEYVKGVRRARRDGHRRAPILSDPAANVWGVVGLCAWVAVGATIAWEAIELVAAANPFPIPGIAGGRLSYSQTIAVAVFTVAYYGFGKQFFLLRFDRRGAAYFRLFLFLVWLMPILVAIASGIASFGDRVVQMILGVSPWAGIALSIDGWQGANGADAQWVRFMALLPSLTFAFGFHFLLMNEQRRIDRELADSPVRKVEPEPAFA